MFPIAMPQAHSNPNLPNLPLNFSRDENDNSDPRKETFANFVKSLCCPSIAVNQFLVIMSFVQILFFIISLSLSENIIGPFLHPTIQVLDKMGARNPYKIHNGEVHRLFTPILLHASFMHIVLNLIMQLIFGICLETSIGTLSMSVLYILSGIGGNLMAILLSNNLSVGCSTSVFGILGGHLGFVIVNWDSLAPYGQMRFQYVCILIIIIVLSIVMGFAGGNQDNFGHLGGLIMGILISFALLKPFFNPEGVSSYKKWGIIGIVIFFGLFLTLFYTSRSPPKLNI